MDILSFQEALDATEVTEGARHTLLGNGFSISWRPELFAYASLYEKAELSGLLPGKQELFEALDTKDFERVMEHLGTGSRLAELYKAHPNVVSRLASDIDVVRHGLADVISQVHPDTRFSLPDAEADSAREFLANFESIFTLNYDLLLYWTLLRDTSIHATDFRDGFQWPTYEVRNALVWKESVAESVQNLHYLHGALHYFQQGGVLHKLHYGRDPLLTQIREAILNGEHPLVVTEGTTAEKRARIETHEYLRFCRSALATAQGSMFIHGASLSPNDDHVWQVIEGRASRIDHIYVSVHGDPDGESAQQVVQRANLIATRRRSNGGARLQVQFYDANTAHVWR